MRTIRCDGSPEAVAALVDAVTRALDGGPAVHPLSPAGPAPALPSSRTLPSSRVDAAPAHPLSPAGAAPAHPARGCATPAPRVADTTAVVVSTSGSGGEPKLVELAVSALRASAQATHARLGGAARWLLALPAEHIAGVQVIVRAVLAGSVPIVQDLRTGFRPADFVAATARLGTGRRATSLVPTQLLRLFDAGAPARAALCSFDAVLVGGAALDPSLRARADAAGVRLVGTYGMSETAGGCVYDGTPLDGVRIDLRDSGLIRLGGPTLATGYLGRPAETAAAFTDGWFRTGDLGRWRDGRLEVLGRADDVIVTGGENVAPGVVEQTLTAQPGVRAACVVGVSDPEWGQVVAAAVVPDPAAPPDHARLRAAVRDLLGRAAVPRRLLDLPALPLRGVGKPDRVAVARLFDRDHPHE